MHGQTTRKRTTSALPGSCPDRRGRNLRPKQHAMRSTTCANTQAHVMCTLPCELFRRHAASAPKSPGMEPSRCSGVSDPGSQWLQHSRYFDK